MQRIFTSLFSAGISLALLALLAAGSAGSAAARPRPIADGIAPFAQFVELRTQAYGIDDGHVFLATPQLLNRAAPNSVFVALQWASWQNELEARIVTVIGMAPPTQTSPYDGVRGFRPNDLTFSGTNTLTIAGATYSPSFAGLRTRAELAQMAPELELGQLVSNNRELYAVVIWEGVQYANGGRINAGLAASKIIPPHTRPWRDGYILPGLWRDVYVTLGIDVPNERHTYAMNADDIIVAATDHFQPTGTGTHELVTIMGQADSELGDPWQRLFSITRATATEPNVQPAVMAPAELTDANGVVHFSSSALMTLQEIQLQHSWVDVSHLAGDGPYLVDYWPDVTMVP